MNIENTLCDIKQSQKTTYSMTLYLCNIQNRQIHKCRKQISGYQRLGEEENGRLLLNGYDFPLGWGKWSGIRQWRWMQNTANILKKKKTLSFTLRNGSVSSFAHSFPTLCDPIGLQHVRLPCPSPTPGACSNSCPSSQWCHPTILSSVIAFSSCLQSFLN